MSSDMQHDTSLEAGLLRKQHQEEEKSQRSGRGFGDRALGHPDTCPGTQENRKMSPLRRFLIIAFIGLVALMGLAAAGGPCRRAGAVQNHAVILDKRQATGSNTTIPPANSNQASESQQSNTGATQTVDNTVTSTVVTTETVHQPGGSPTGTSSTGKSEPGSSSPASSPSSSSPVSSPPASSQGPSSNPPTSVPTSQAPPSSSKSTSQSAPPPVSTSAPSTSSTPSETTPRRTITTGTVTTSSAVQETFTRTNGDGGIETITSTSWVEIRPSSTGSTDPSLQNAANGRGAAGSVAVGVAGIIAGVMMI
ncbi:hypothetical protein ISF_01644 [Cordyceps fumosorosea ARSEF 2679]|uniref:Uncharacterized protein n=1 Tax=Cordyceps fumosorosea (strain ARSEF 2679) TaxID=1081104 RepID=A0A168DG13_CORFA|nr:hypothetical protein ISF_01644 [Cordyceps fumosorosea ARSEF 2679]OAA72571.1 hypothetical protein ISF_01644 [Cordyceps fumosorosea ARSEF 2679]